MKKWEILFLTLILIAAFFVRLYRLNNPVADWHSWRQADTSAVSRSFVENGFDLLHPTFEDISNVPSGLDNPKGYRFVEFPIYNVAQAGLFLIFKHFTLEEWGRLVSIIASIFSIVFIYLLGKRYGNTLIGFASAFFYAFVPYDIYYNRTILPDTSMISATLATLFFFDKFAGEKKLTWRIVFFCLSIIFGATALLLKPYAIFFFLPIFYSAWRTWKWKLVFNPFVYVFLIFSAIPLGLWRVWMLKYPAGIPASDWLFNGGNIRFTGAYFYWLFADRIARLILGYWGLPLVLVGLLSKRKTLPFFLLMIASSLLYMVIIARGNVQHDYYQILIIPSLAFLFGLGIDVIFSLSKEYVSTIGAYIVIFLSTVAMLAFGWYFVRDYFNINNPSMVAAGQAVQSITPKNAKVIAPLDGDTSFLYQTDRKGWASFEKSLPELIDMGASYLVLLNPTQNDFNGVGKEYTIVASTPQYIILNLQKKQ